MDIHALAPLLREKVGAALRARTASPRAAPPPPPAPVREARPRRRRPRGRGVRGGGHRLVHGRAAGAGGADPRAPGGVRAGRRRRPAHAARIHRDAGGAAGPAQRPARGRGPRRRRGARPGRCSSPPGGGRCGWSGRRTAPWWRGCATTPPQPAPALVDALFDSVARRGGDGVRGRGADGDGERRRGRAGVHPRRGGRGLVESERTAVINGMPAAARGSAERDVPLDEMAGVLAAIVGVD